MLVDEENKIEDIEIPDLNGKSEKFLKKRSKLEGLLGNIKNKSKGCVSNDTKTDKVVSCSNSVFNEDLFVICSNYRKSKISNNKKENNEDESKKGTQSESDSDEVILHDSSINEDEFLRSLENMEIPIDNSKKGGKDNSPPDVIDNSQQGAIDKTNQGVIDKSNQGGIDKSHKGVIDKSNQGVIDKCHQVIDNSQQSVIVIDDDDDDILEITTFNVKKEESKKNRNNTTNKIKDNLKTSNNTLNIPKNMPVLVKFNNREVASPKSFDSCSSKISSQDVDSISDTNVKFILDEEIDEYKAINDVSANDEAVLIKKENLKQESSKEREITKNMTTCIVEEKSDQDEKSARMNDYYKKCKKVYQRKDKTDVNKNELNKVDDEKQPVQINTCFVNTCQKLRTCQMTKI